MNGDRVDADRRRQIDIEHAIVIRALETAKEVISMSLAESFSPRLQALVVAELERGISAACAIHRIAIGIGQ